MTTFIYFTRRSDGNEVYCNVDHISRFVATSEGTHVRFDDGSIEVIAESPAEVATRLQQASETVA